MRYNAEIRRLEGVLRSRRSLAPLGTSLPRRAQIFRCFTRVNSRAFAVPPLASSSPDVPAVSSARLALTEDSIHHPLNPILDCGVMPAARNYFAKVVTPCGARRRIFDRNLTRGFNGVNYAARGEKPPSRESIVESRSSRTSPLSNLCSRPWLFPVANDGLTESRQSRVSY